MRSSSVLGWWRGGAAKAMPRIKTGANNGSLVGDISFITGRIGGGFLGHNYSNGGFVEVRLPPRWL
jgi:hypothetical protein